MKHFKVKVSGKVQGVWFRKSTQEVASQLGVNGVVKNMPDGSVYIEAEANDQQLEKFLEFCRKGSPLAVVSDLSIEEGEFRAYHDFRIIH